MSQLAEALAFAAIRRTTFESPMSTPPLRILIVDDHVENRHVARWMLSRAFHEPVLFEAESCQPAVEICESQPINAILMDASASDFEATCSMLVQKAKSSCIAFVLIVGAHEPTPRAFSENLGVEHWLVKELLSAYTLEMAMRNAIEIASLRRLIGQQSVEVQRLVTSEAQVRADAETQAQAAAASLAEANSKRLQAVVEPLPMFGIQLDRPKLAVKGIGAYSAEDQALANQFQADLTPPGSPFIEGFEIAGMTLTAEATGGDYYDYLPNGDGLLAITIGECSGRGLTPTMLATSLRAYLRVLSSTISDPSDIVSQANRFITEDIGGEEFLITLMLVQIDQLTKRIRYASAGHQGFHMDRDGKTQVLHSTGMPMGLQAETVIPEGQSIRLKVGEILVLVTDGIQKMTSPSGERFGVERMLNVIRENRQLPPRMIVSYLKRVCLEFAGPNGQDDDITAVLVRAEGSNGLM